MGGEILLTYPVLQLPVKKRIKIKVDYFTDVYVIVKRQASTFFNTVDKKELDIIENLVTTDNYNLKNIYILSAR